jgi:hypothetical protein
MTTLKGLVTFLMVVTLIFFFVYISVQRSKLASNGRYTIGTTIAQNGKFISLKFKVNGQEFVADHNRLKYSPEERDGRYFIKYLPSDPEVNEVYWDKPVPDCIGEAPPEGWKEIPKCK